MFADPGRGVGRLVDDVGRGRGWIRGVGGGIGRMFVIFLADAEVDGSGTGLDC